ncbi:MAG: hypothetical protein FJ288_18910 [Planctomycetes bacterium]|nr:hypothetical protein [Planctomycetota bacterium]
MGRHSGLGTALLIGMLMCVSCGSSPESPTAAGADPDVTTRGNLEVTARLAEVPEGAIFKRELYNYATVLKYQVLQVHRGEWSGGTLYVGHYNPFKPRAEAADQRIKDVGGNLKAFRAGQVHRMALAGPIDENYMGGIVNKYFGQDTGTIHWAVWTNLVSD